jgi:RNA polymerase sigma factor (sigma-70 family)
VPAELSERELVARAVAGDDSAFEELVGEHRRRLWSLCLRLTGNAQDAEDALQDALVAAWQHLGSFRQDSRFGTWIYRIAANASLAVVRRRRDIPFDPVEMPEGEGPRDPGVQVSDRELVRGAIAALPEPFRVALVLREIGDLSYEEIAVHQGIGVQTVKSRLSRARAAVLANLRSADPQERAG